MKLIFIKMTVKIELIIQRLCTPFEALFQDTNAILTTNISIPCMSQSGVLTFRIAGFEDPIIINQWVCDQFPVHLTATHHVNLLYYPTVILPDFIDLDLVVRFV